MSLDDLQAQLRGALDQQFAALKTHYEQAIADARRQAQADAERELQQKLDGARAEWDVDLRAQLGAARAESEVQLRAQLDAARREWEGQLHAQLEAARAESEVQRRAQLEAARREWEGQLRAQVEAARGESEVQLRVQLEAARREWEGQLRAQVEAARGESEVQLRAQLEAARREWEGQLHAHLEAARAEAGQAAADAAAQERQALEQAVASTRRSVELELESQRRRAQKDLSRQREQASAALQAEQERSKGEIDALRQRMQADAAAAAARAAAAGPAAAAPLNPTLPAGRVLAGLQALDAAETLSQALETLLQHAAAVAGRAAIFLINGDRLKAWKAVGIPDIDVQTVESSIGARDLLARAIQSGHVESSGPTAPAPPFARLSSDRIGVAAPLLVGGRPVAVLYADTGADAKAAPGWPDAVDMIARHGSATIALRTAARTLDVLRGGPDGGAGGDEGARRYARLLVSEIKLYNEPAVRAGRQQRDLLQRLRTEIDRAQRLYEERVSPAVGARQAYFQQELVQTLADGDATLLGN